jgi:hypothetical protein
VAATVVTFFTFLPSFVFILAGGPLIESTHGKLGFTAPLSAITAAVVGVIVNLACSSPTTCCGRRASAAASSGRVGRHRLAAALALFRFKVGASQALEVERQRAIRDSGKVERIDYVNSSGRVVDSKYTLAHDEKQRAACCCPLPMRRRASRPSAPPPRVSRPSAWPG